LNFLLQETVSRDWGELLINKIDKTYFLNVAKNGFYLILIVFYIETKQVGSSVCNTFWQLN